MKKLSAETELALTRFSAIMRTELQKNVHKGPILEWTNFHELITDLEYHKAKLLLAIRVRNKGAMREYMADTANILFALAHSLGVLDGDINMETAYTVGDHNSIFVEIPLDKQVVHSTLAP
jgi:hypothetical protein